MSDFVVIARFDEKTEKKINDLRDKLCSCGLSIPEWPVHITIAAYENIDKELLCKWTADFAEVHNKVKIGLHSVGVFPIENTHSGTTVFITPAHSKEFVDFYWEFHNEFEEYCTGIGYYNSIKHGNPVMHITLAAVNINELQSTMNIILKSDVFGTAEINALEVYTYPMKLIKRFELK